MPVSHLYLSSTVKVSSPKPRYVNGLNFIIKCIEATKIQIHRFSMRSVKFRLVRFVYILFNQ